MEARGSDGGRAGLTFCAKAGVRAAYEEGGCAPMTRVIGWGGTTSNLQLPTPKLHPDQHFQAALLLEIAAGN
jgi:hypothetical protein